MMQGWVAGLLATLAMVIVVGVGVVVVVSSSGDTAIVDLEAGDCIELPDDADATGAVDTVVTVDCDVPHLAEVVSVGDLDPGDAPYPSDAELFAEVERRCRDAGVVDSDAFGLLPVAPTEALWDSFDGRYLCIAVPFGGEPVTGSLVADGRRG